MNEEYYQSSYQYSYDEAWYEYAGDLQDENANYVAQEESNTYIDETKPYFYQRIPAYSHSSPISALAIDSIADVIYIAGEATSTKRQRTSESATSVLAAHTFSDGVLYSSCVANNGPRQEVLDDLYFSLYGFKKNSGLSFKIPSHAYQPLYQPNSSIAQSPGVQKILPFSSKMVTARGEEVTEGYVCTVSPNSVRLHTRGGLLTNSVNIEGMMSGTFHPSSYIHGSDPKSIALNTTHVTVGGIATKASSLNLHCLDLYSGSLKSVASHTVRADAVYGNAKLCISDMETNFDTNNIVCGCSDGTLRIFDGSWRGGNYMECAKVKAHGGGIAHIASCGNLICTTGYSSRNGANTSSGNLFAYPDEHILVFDIRYLGRGGIAHPFSGIKGGPRFVSFIPSLEDGIENRILIASGQVGGGLQVITPFESLTEVPITNDYFQPPMDSMSECITAVSVSGGDVIIGTSYGVVHSYHLSTYPEMDLPYTGSKTTIPRPGDVKLEFPSYEPQPPSLELDPCVLEGNFCHNSAYYSVFNSYILQKEPIVTPLSMNGSVNPYMFGPLSESKLIPTSKRLLSKKVLDIVAKSSDFLTSIPTEALGISTPNISVHEEKNFNCILFGDEKNVCYDHSDPRRKENKSNEKYGKGQIPEIYQSKDRLPGAMFSLFDVAALNDTLFPGCDYPPTMSNAYVSSVLILLYFIPEIRGAMFSCQKFGCVKKSSKILNDSPILSAELGFLYHQMHMLSSYAMVQPKAGSQRDICRPILGTFTPSNFLSAFVMMPEASALALLDNSAAAVEVARRPEAFYRFLLHHLDKELNGNARERLDENFIDSLKGIDSVSMNHFINNPSSVSITSTRSYTLELSYDYFLCRNDETGMPAFGEVLQYSLCKDARLRAWCDDTKAYETVVQRKIVTSLPSILSISCACSGKHGSDRIPIWRQKEDSHWLPEVIEIEIEADGNILTRQLKTENDSGGWQEFKGHRLPRSVSETLRKQKGFTHKIKKVKYRLDCALTFLNQGASDSGQHVVHARVPKMYKEQILKTQLEKVKECKNYHREMTLVRDLTNEDLEKRQIYLENQISELKSNNTEDWILFNGPNVSSTSLTDVCSYDVSFKEPCILVYRQIDDEHETHVPTPQFDIPMKVWDNSDFVKFSSAKTVAFDAEFVQVENEESILTASGSKVFLREARNAVGRISLIDCDNNGRVLCDHHVLPREPVLDYLTRFSGIVADDLNPKTTRHHLISSRDAYLLLRYLVDKGVTFVGHGLRQDFLTVNLFVPPSQIIDTVDLFHLENRRFISLRFLANVLLQKDIQQEIHDSMEDSRAAFELLMKAVALSKEGTFEKVLNQIYEIGSKSDWKVADIKRK